MCAPATYSNAVLDQIGAVAFKIGFKFIEAAFHLALRLLDPLRVEFDRWLSMRLERCIQFWHQLFVQLCIERIGFEFNYGQAIRINL